MLKYCIGLHQLKNKEYEISLIILVCENNYGLYWTRTKNPSFTVNFNPVVIINDGGLDHHAIPSTLTKLINIIC